MASTGPNGAGTGTRVTLSGYASWANPGNITLDDGSSSTDYLDRISEFTRSSDYLMASNFGFNVPNGATINGIVVEIKRSAFTSAGSPADLLIQLTSNALATGLAGNNKASASIWPTTAAYATYGSSSDVWAFSPTTSVVNATGFGVAIRASVLAGKGNNTVAVDHVRITVYYTEGGGGGGGAVTRSASSMVPGARGRPCYLPGGSGGFVNN